MSVGPDLMALLAGRPGLPASGLPASTQPAQAGRQPTAELQASIHALHAAIAAEPEPTDKQMLTTALGILLKVQAKNMAEAGARGPREAMMAGLAPSSG